MGSVGSSAERRRPLPGPVLSCQPCGGHPLLESEEELSALCSAMNGAHQNTCKIHAEYMQDTSGYVLYRKPPQFV